MISYAEFKKMELKVGKVLSVEDHASADKLYVLKVDIGEEKPRQLVAGIKKYYTPEKLVGKRVIVVANLEPVILRGMESQGMILAAQEDEEKVVLLTTDHEIKSGAKIL